MPTEIVKVKSGNNPRSFERGNGAGPHQKSAIGGRGRVGERGAEGAEDAGDLPEEGLAHEVVGERLFVRGTAGAARTDRTVFETS